MSAFIHRHCLCKNQRRQIAVIQIHRTGFFGAFDAGYPGVGLYVPAEGACPEQLAVNGYCVRSVRVIGRFRHFQPLEIAAGLLVVQISLDRSSCSRAAADPG
ncbi:hypothetical protein D3C75_751890 [compost metagenome]